VNIYQDLSAFSRPKGIRGRPAWFVQLWWIFDACLIRPTPQVLYSWRRFAWRLFGAKVGRNVLIRSGARAIYPWKVTIGDFCWIGEKVTFDSIGDIQIGEHSVISQEAYLCAATHDYRDPSFPIIAPGIVIGAECWIGARVFVGPGVSVQKGAVVGACAVVVSNIAEGTVVAGCPARNLGFRKSGAVYGKPIIGQTLPSKD
jgi:putative colanic acid biosynthesis acetyltransferase WcaF